MYPIASQTVTNPNTVIVFNFTSIPQTFTHLQLRCFGRTTNASIGAFGYIYYNLDFGNNYTQHYLQGDGSSASSSGAVSLIGNNLVTPTGSSATSNVYNNTIVDILDYSNANKYKTNRQIGGFDNNGSGYVQMFSGLWQSTAAINLIQVSTGNSSVYWAAGTRFDLYGIQTSNATGA
jgi:hypothetical protein